MPDGKKYKVRVRIIEGIEGNHFHFGGWGWGWVLEMEGVSFIPTSQKLTQQG